MSTKGKILIFLVVGVLLLATGSPQPLVSAARASVSGQGNASDGVTIPYPGRLSDETGQKVAQGVYAFTFYLYDLETGGQPLWSEVQEGVAVKDGAFTTSLGSVNPISPALLDGRDLWLSTSVRGPGESEFTSLTPRQRVSATSPTSPTSATAGGACPHDHFGEVWYWGTNTGIGLDLHGSVPWSNGLLKVTNQLSGPSVWGLNTGGGNAIRGDGYGTSIGVYGEGADGPGVAGRSATTYGVEGATDSGIAGVYAHSTDGYGLFAHSDNGTSIYVDGAGSHGVYVASAGWDGVAVYSAAVAGMYVHSAGADGILVDTANWDGVHVTGPVGGSYYGSGKKGAEDFMVLNTGEVRSEVGFATPAEDYAVMMNIQGTKSDYEPGDVLVINTDQSQMAGLCASSYSSAVIGVYSAAPGFLGGQAVTDPAGEDGRIPVAVMGIVLVKVSTENGPILPGDLLVTSSTPGYAMRGDNPQAGTILGKALEPLDSGTGLILVLLTLR